MIYNTTQLSPDLAFERHIFHRDMFAHYLRWTHVLKIAKIGMNVLDIGCGSGNLAEVLYRNMYKANKYLGIDIRKQMIEKNKEKFKNVPWVEFQQQDLCRHFQFNEKWDIITCFEVIEHIGKENGKVLLRNISDNMQENTIFLISTPCYDEAVGAANNHIINGIVGEYTFDEMKSMLSEFFIIEKVYGTFASQKDYKDKMTTEQKIFYEQAKEYFDSNILANLMAPLFPEYSRNCLWVCKLKIEE